MAEGRINGFRIDFNGMDVTNEGEFEICYMGCFRSWDEATVYGTRYLKGEDAEISTKDPTEEVTSEATEETTAAPAGNDPEAPTNAPDGNATADPADTDAPKTGCKSVLGIGAAALLCAIAAAVALSRKE